MTTRICVVGCGAIGSLYAAHLGRLEDVEMWVVDPWVAQVEAITADGLRVTGRADFVAPVRARTSAAEVPPCDLGILATKAEHTRAAMQDCAAVFADGAVASVQNGLGNEEVVADFVPRVIRGSILPAGAVTAPGVVRFDAPGDTWLGPFEPRPAPMEDVTRLAELLERAGLPCHALEDARGPQWDKVVFNAATSPLAALTGLPVGEVCTRPGLRAQVGALVAEAGAVRDALGVGAGADPRSLLAEAVEHAYHHRPSMLQDVVARRRTEIAVLNGGIADQGRLVGVPTPWHDAMVALVRGLERSWDLEDGSH